MSTLEERREAAARKLKQLDAQIAQKKAREKTREAKQRDHVLIQLGGLVLRYSGLSWNEIDPQKVDAFCRTNADILRRALGTEEMDAKTAAVAWKELRAQQREAKAKTRNAKTREAAFAAENQRPDAPSDAQQKLVRCAGCGAEALVPAYYHYHTCPQCGTRSDV